MDEADGFNVAGYLEVDKATGYPYYFVFFHGGEPGVRLCVAEDGGILAPDKDIVGVGGEEGFKTIAPAGNLLGGIPSSRHADDVVDERVATGREIARGTEADNIIDCLN